MSHNFFVLWYSSAVPSWSLLVAYATLLWVGLGLAAAGAAPAAAKDVSPLPPSIGRSK